MNFLHGLYYGISLIITVPVLATWLTYKVLNRISNKPLKAFHSSINWTTFLYIISVIFLFEILFSVQIIGFVIVFLLMLMIIIVLGQWKIKEEIYIKKAINLLWRIAFLLFFSLYCLLIIVGIIQRILN